MKGLGCLSKGMRQQIHRLWPLVGVRSLADVQGPTHGPWLVKLLYQGVLTDAVVEQARQGRVRTIDSRCLVWSHVVPELLGAGGSLLELDISHTRSLQGNCRGPNGQERSDTYSNKQKTKVPIVLYALHGRHPSHFLPRTLPASVGPYFSVPPGPET